MIDHKKLANAVRDELIRQAAASGNLISYSEEANEIDLDGAIDLAALVVAIERVMQQAMALSDLAEQDGKLLDVPAKPPVKP